MFDMSMYYVCRSRLGCQVFVSDDLEGIVLRIPSETRDVRDS